ncbi:3-oxoacyl-[acyl-carrier-protein] synthase III C-terminal domain-containing protein [Tardiphaga sp.]|uniref:3-oxoacyl-[acyl-carrier-protein] synthase III C-terminal domain-containing protein n=1 Tax=Tardiphaga sp. TaxID=1926292 RepID=UPI0037D999BB
MIGIAAIGAYLPPTRIDNVGRAAEAGKTPEFIAGKIGFRRLPRKAPDEGVIDLCIRAYDDLRSRCPVDPASIDCLILCTQNPDRGGLPHNSALLQSTLKLSEKLAAFDVSLGCSGYVYGLSIARAFMEANGLKNGLLFTADPYSRIIEPGDWDTDLLFGDAAAVTLLSANPRYNLCSGMFGTNGAMGHSISIEPAAGRLRMLGANVFKFSMTEVPNQIAAYLKRENLSLDDIDLLLLHQGSKFIIDNLRNKMELSAERAPFAASDTGNLVSSSLPLMLMPYLLQEVSNPKRILLSGFGVGLSWATMLIERAGPVDDVA